jgi:hypothetical protein
LILCLHHGGEAVERRIERQQARRGRAVDAEDAALDRGRLADVLLGLIPRDRAVAVGGCRGTPRYEHRSEHDGERQPSHALDPPSLKLL